MLNRSLSLLSKAHEIPVLGSLLKRDVGKFSAQDLDSFRETQNIAYQAAREVGKMLEPGWTEIRAASLLEDYCRDMGASNFLHKGFAWFGERSSFTGMRDFFQSIPTDRRLKENEVVILDIAPIYNGYPADIGYALSLEKNEEFSQALKVLKGFRQEIPKLFLDKSLKGKDIYRIVDEKINQAGYFSVHARYPLGVLGHRMYPLPLTSIPGVLKPFTWQAYWGLMSRGFFSETLTANTEGDLDGLWAIEPHFGTEKFGVKFEEMLWVKNGKAEWIGEEVFYE